MKEGYNMDLNGKHAMTARFCLTILLGMSIIYDNTPPVSAMRSVKTATLVVMYDSRPIMDKRLVKIIETWANMTTVSLGWKKKENVYAPVIQEIRRMSNGSFPFWQISGMVNSIYACRHGYDFAYVLPIRRRPDTRWKDAVDCPYNKTIDRSSPWCKLLAVAIGLAKKYDTVMFVDSDEVLSSHESSTAPISEMISRFNSVPGQIDVPRGWQGGLCNYTPVSNNRETTAPILWVQADWCYKPNSGLMVWNGSARESRHLLQKWWKWSNNATYTKHPYEQAALYKHSGVGIYNYFKVLARMLPDPEGGPTLEHSIRHMLMYPATHLHARHGTPEAFLEAFRQARASALQCKIGQYYKYVDTRKLTRTLLEKGII